MYFRSAFPDRDEPYRIPENYSGNAFAPPPDAEEPQTPPKPPTPSPDADEPQALPTTVASDEAPPKKAPPSLALPSFLSAWLPPKPRAFGGGSPTGIDTEELLLLGVILLLSQNNADDDIVLLLLLLLLYK